MNWPAENLEPAVRDPKKLRRTALVLVGVMIVGGFLILYAYQKRAAKEAEDDRPAYLTRLFPKEKYDLKLWRQDESEGSLLDLGGDVFVIVPVVFKQPDSWNQTREVLMELAERYGSRDDFHIVCITLDPENEPPLELGEFAKELDAELPFWWLAGAREESIHKYFKNVLRAGFMPKKEDSKWVYDNSIAIVDRDLHVRQPTIRARKPSGKELNYRTNVAIDFEQAAKWDAEGRSEGLDKSNVDVLKDMLFKTIDELLATPAQKS